MESEKPEINPKCLGIHQKGLKKVQTKCFWSFSEDASSRVVSSSRGCISLFDVIYDSCHYCRLHSSPPTYHLNNSRINLCHM